MSGNPELDEKIREWARGHPVCKRYMGNMVLLREFYKQKHKAECVKDLIPEGLASLKVMIVKKFPDRAVHLCKVCKKKACPDSCGAKDYAEFVGRAYVATDLLYEGDDPKESNIQITMPPWSDIPECEEHKMYEVEGECRLNTYREPAKLEVQAKVVREMSMEDSPDSDTETKSVEDIVKLMMSKFPNGVEKERWDAMLQDYNIEVISKVMKSMNLVMKDGKVVEG